MKIASESIDQCPRKANIFKECDLKETLPFKKLKNLFTGVCKHIIETRKTNRFFRNDKFLCSLQITEINSILL